MKNLTEFSGLVLRRAAEVRAQKLTELKAQLESAPAEAPPAPEAEVAPAAAEDSTAEMATGSDTGSDTEADTGSDAGTDTEAVAVEASEDAPSIEAASSDEAADKGPRVDDAALIAAVAEEMGLSEERAKYIMGALKAVGRKHLAQVRNVRVFQGETGPAGSFSVDDIHFVVDKIIVPAAARPGRDDRKGGKGGKGRDSKGSGRGGPGGGGGGGGFGGGPRPSGGRATGGFDGATRDERPGDVPLGGLGWSLSRAPGEKRGEGRGKPPGKGPRRGKPGGRPGGGRPEGDRPGGGGGGKPGDKPGEGQRRSRGGRGRGGQGKTPEVIVKPTVVAPPKQEAPGSTPAPAPDNGSESK